MPAFKILGDFSTRPLAGDDMQILCIVQVFFRVLQLCICIIPFSIDYYIYYSQGRNYILNGYPTWCPQFFTFEQRINRLILTDEEREQITIERNHASEYLLIGAYFFFFVELLWAKAVWTASLMGTPSDSKRRVKFLRPLLLIKMFFINLLPAVLFSYGIFKVHEMRQNNYGCGDEDPVHTGQDSLWFMFFSFLIFSYALELSFWVMIIVNRLTRDLRRNIGFTHRFFDAGRVEMLLGGLLKCMTCCKKGGGGHELRWSWLQNKSHLKDCAVAFMDLIDNETTFDFVISDVYVGMKILARVQGEEKVKALSHLKVAAARHSLNASELPVTSDNDLDRTDRLKSTVRLSALRALLTKETHYKSVYALQAHGDKYDVIEEKLLSLENETDTMALADAARFVTHSLTIYSKIKKAVQEMCGKKNIQSFSMPLESLFSNDFYLTNISGQEQTKICYSNFYNGIYATPYALLIDEAAKAIVITIRGTLSLEDMVIDLDFVPENLREVGEKCGFDGNGYYCHKGILQRCKWLYNDIKKQRVLKHLYSEGSPVKTYRLVVVGHSLGAGCACTLATMLRPSIGNTTCFAFEPPGCVFDEGMSKKCEDFITSVVRQDDMFPRLSRQNADLLRDQFLEIFARIKVSKYSLFRDVQTPCPDSQLSRRNAKVLCRKNEASRDSFYFEQLRNFRNERAEKNRLNSVELYIPGKIIHLVDASVDGSRYIPVWASRFEFNQIVLSERMVSDHSVVVLVDVLKDIRLDADEEVLSEPYSFSAEESNDEMQIMEDPLPSVRCCSTPQGRRTFFLSLGATVALILSLLTNHRCDLIVRNLIIVNDTLLEEGSMNFGLYGYELKICADEESDCSLSADGTYINSGTCSPFPPTFIPGSIMMASRIFSHFSGIFGSIVFGIAWSSTCMMLNKSTWHGLTVLSLLSSVCQSLVLLVRHSDFCSKTHSLTNAVSDGIVVCEMGEAGTTAIISAAIFFLSAVGSEYMAMRAKVRKKERKEKMQFNSVFENGSVATAGKWAGEVAT